MYTPGTREAVCIEPYTALPDMFRLSTAGIDTGMKILSPGEGAEGRMTVRLEALISV